MLRLTMNKLKAFRCMNAIKTGEGTGHVVLTRKEVLAPLKKKKLPCSLSFYFVFIVYGDLRDRMHTVGKHTKFSFLAGRGCLWSLCRGIPQGGQTQFGPMAFE